MLFIILNAWTEIQVDLERKIYINPYETQPAVLKELSENRIHKDFLFVQAKLIQPTVEQCAITKINLFKLPSPSRDCY